MTISPKKQKKGESAVNTKKNVNDVGRTKDKTADDLRDTVRMFKKLPKNVQNAILELMRTMLHNK